MYVFNDCVCVYVCVPLGFPRAPPPCRSSNQSTERPFGPRDRGGATAELREETVGEGHVCTHCRLSSTPTVVKSATDGPFSEQASAEKLIDEASLHRNAVKRSVLLFLVLKERGGEPKRAF